MYVQPCIYFVNNILLLNKGAIYIDQNILAVSTSVEHSSLIILAGFFASMLPYFSGIDFWLTKNLKFDK